MADKNVKKELNAENLEGVAGGAAVEIKNIDKRDVGLNPWHDDDEPSFATGSMTKEEILRQGDPGPDPLAPSIDVEDH